MLPKSEMENQNWACMTMKHLIVQTNASIMNNQLADTICL
jgi:hypothetical protein